MEWELLRPLSEEERREVLRLARRRRFRRGEVLFHEGDPGDTLHLIDRGHVAMRVTTPLGDVATLIIEGPGGYFGELALISENGTRNSTVVALDAVETLGLHRDQFDELRRKLRELRPHAGHRHGRGSAPTFGPIGRGPLRPGRNPGLPSAWSIWPPSFQPAASCRQSP